jgi:hypothetical protein
VVVTGANVFLETVRGVSVCVVCCVVMFGLLPFIFFLYNEAQLSCVFEKKKVATNIITNVARSSQVCTKLDIKHIKFM